MVGVMADPLTSQTDQTNDLQSQTGSELQSLFPEDNIQAPSTPQQEIDTLFSEPPAGLAQAQNLIQLRDNPQAIDFLLGTAERFKKGQLPFNKQSWEDAQANVRSYESEVQPKLMEAQSKGDWLEMAKLSTLGVGKVIGAYLQSGFGATNEDVNRAQQSLAARNFIGTIKDPKEAARALELAAVYSDDLDSGVSIVPKDQKPAMSFGTGPFTAKVGMNLAQGEEYLRDLQSDRNKALGTAGLRNFAIQSGDQFLPFVSIGDVIVDENDPDQVARRAALTNKINEVIQKDYGISTVAGAAAGSVGSFVTVGAGATKLLGQAAKLGEATVKVPTLMSRGATYATIGAAQSFEGDPRNLSFGQRLASIFSESAILGLAEGAGNKLEESIDHSLSNYLVSSALGKNLPEFAPVIGSAAKILGTTIGETSSEEIEAVLRGQDPVQQFLQNLGASFGVGLGMGIPGVAGGMMAARRAKIYNQANDTFTKIVKGYVDGIKADPKLTEEQKQESYSKLYTQFDTPQAQNIIRATIAGSSIDPTVSPESAKVVDDIINANKQNVIESLLAKKVSEAEAVKPGPAEPALATITGPVDEAQAEEAFAELVGMFEQGAKDISIENTPANEAKIKWLQGQGRIEGDFSPDNKTFVVKNVKNAAGVWAMGTPAVEFNQDLKDQILIRAEQLEIPDTERDALEKELEKAGTDEDINEVALRFMGPDDYDLAVERDAIKKGERVEIERPVELRIREYNARIEALNKQLREAVAEDKPQLQQLITQLTQARDQEIGAREERGQLSVADQIKKYEEEADKEIETKQMAGQLAPELEARPEVVLPINNPQSDRYKKFSKLTEPDPRENDVNALGQVFNLNRPETVELLQSLGALDENLRPLKTPAEVAQEFINRKKSYLQGKALSGYQGFNISDEVAQAFIREFQLQIRSGVPVISLSTLFNSRLRDFIRLARPRMKAGIGIGMAVDFDKPGVRVNRISKEQFASENDLNEDASDVVDQAMDEIDAALVEVPGASNVSPARRQEAMGIIAQQIVPQVRNSLATDAEKLALDVIVSGAADLAVKAQAANLSVDAVNALVDPVKKKLQHAIVSRFRQLSSENNLPSSEVEVPAGARVAGAIPAAQRQELINRYRDMIASSLLDQDKADETRIAADVLYNNLLSENSKEAFTSLETFLNNVEDNLLSQPAIDSVVNNINDFLQGSIDDGLSKQDVDGYVKKLNDLSIPYYEAIGEQPDETSPEYKKLTRNFRSNILSIFDQAEAKRNENLKPKGKIDETKTALTEREKARRDLEARKAKQAPAPKGILKEAVPPTGPEMGRGVERPATVPGRLGVERPRGQAVPKAFVEAPGQQNKTYPLNAVNSLGNQVVSRLSEEQKQDSEAAIVAMESSKNNAFYLANGPGTGKTRVLLATAKYYLDRGFNVIYLTSPDAVTPNWDNGTIGGSIQKDAELLGIPLAVRGGRGDKKQGLPIEKVPGKILVTTYNSEYLKKISDITDAKTIVLFDEQHNGRNLYKKVQEGAEASWAVLMDQISSKAGRVLMASGTPFESPDQLFSLGRLGIFNTESPDSLFNRLGFTKEYLKGSKKSYWRLADGVSYQEMQDRMEEYVDKLIKDGVVRSRSLKLDGVNVQFKDVPLDNTIVKTLDDIKARYGGDQITNIAALRAMVATQKRALETYKVDAAAKQAVDAIRRGKKPVLYVGFVSEEDSKNNKVDPTSRSLEEALLKLNPELKIARMYTGADQTKEEAMVAFNSGEANVLIATKEKGGTGIELDDKFGDESREMIILSPPISAIQAVQLIYRVWRTDSASRPNVVFLESQAEVDQYNLDRMRSKLRLLEATVGSGLTRLQADQEIEKNINPETVVTKVETPTADEVSQVDSTVRGILGNAYQNNLITLKDAKGVTRTYSVKVAPGSEHMAAAQAGDTNDSDTIILNPAKIQKAKQILGDEAFRKYFNQVLVEEMIHVETYRYFRDQGLDPTEEIMAIGSGLSFETRLQIARAYYSNQGEDISNTQIQDKIKNLANDNYLVAMEGIRMMAQLDLTKGVTEQVNSVDPGAIKRANSRINDLIRAEPKGVLARLGLWLNGMLDAVKNKLGILPSAKDRLAIRDSLEDAISRLKTTANSVAKQAEAEPVAAALPIGVTPTSPRQASKLDGYDLRIYRMIENVLEGRTKDVLGVEVADDMFKTVSTGDWLDALDTATRRGLITQQERNLFRTAAKFYTDGGRVSLPALANKALEIAEDLETSGESLPAAAFLPVSTGPTIAEQSVSEYGPYRVQISPYSGEQTTAKSEAQAVGNYVSRFLDAKGSMAFRGKVYTASDKGALIAAIKREGYEKFARRLTPKPGTAPALVPTRTVTVSVGAEPVEIPVETAPAPSAAAEPEMRVSKAASNIITQFVDVIPDGPIKDKLLDYWFYQSTPREEQFVMARDYIAKNGGPEAVVDHFLSGNIKTTLPLQAAIGFELARYLGGKAKTDLLAKGQLAEVMIKLSRKYGTEPGQAVDLWNALNDLAENPEAMKVVVGRQIDDALKGRLAGYAEEEAEIKSGLVDASRRAAEKLVTSPKNQKVLSALGNLIELNKKKVSVTEFEAALNEFFNSEEAKNDAVEFLGEDLAAAPEAEGSDADEIRLNSKQTKALGRLIVKILQRSGNANAMASNPDLVKEALFNVAGIKDSKNPENVRRKIDLYFDAALDYAIKSFGAEALRAARIREQKQLPEGETPGEIEPVQTRGEAKRQRKNTVQKLREESPVPVFIEGKGNVGDEAAALGDAVADSLITQAEKARQEPKVKTALEKLAADVKRMVRNRIKEKGGLPELFEKPKPPTAAESLKERIEKNNLIQEALEMARDTLKNTYTEEELQGLEPFIDEALGRPFTLSDLKRALRTLSSIGGADINVRSLIRESKGDLMTFENKLGELLTNNTNLNLAEQKQVLDYLREGMSELIAQERKTELERIKKRFERAKERKTRKVRSALDRLIEAVNLGVLSDNEVFSQMRGQLGLPELKESERNRLNKLIEDLPLYPRGMIRNKKISEMYQYVKLVSPQAWGELLVNYQTSNLLAGVGTIGINAWSAYVSNLLNGAIMGAFGTTYNLLGNKTKAKAYIDAAKNLNAALWTGNKPALKAAQSVFFKGDYSSIQDALTMELGGVNIWEAILNQAEAYRAGKPGAVKPELPVKVLGQEYRIPLDSKFISSKFGALAPFIFFGRAMAAGDAINKISSRKMYEIAEATNIAAAKFKTQEEIEAEVTRLLNTSPEAIRRAEAKAASEAKEFNLTPQQQALRVEEILEQGRPEEEDVKILAEKTKDFAARATYTNNFEGWFGLLADGLTSLSAKAWPLRLFIKFLRTGSSLANEVLNFLPVVSTVRFYRGSAGMLKESKYYRPPPSPGTVEHDLLLGKMTIGYLMTGMLLAAMKEAMGGEDDPYFNIHFKGPLDPAQREAFFAAGGKLRSIQIGRWRDGKPQFISFEGFPVGMSAPLILSGAIVEAVRYEKRSTAEALVMSSITGGALAMYGILDMAALSGIRQIMSLTSPGTGQKDPKSIVTNLTKTMGNVAGGLIPGYASLRDVEQLWNGFTGAPSARPYEQNLLSTFAQSVPFASKVGNPDLNFLGGNVKTQLANTVPLIRRLTTFGVDSRDYDAGDRSPQAVSDKLMSLFAANRTSLDWDAGPLKDFAMLELMAQAKQDGIDLSPDDFYELKRELTSDEKYEWMERSEPLLREQLGSIIPNLEKLSRPQFVTVVRRIANPIKRAVLRQLLVEKNQQDILYPKTQ